MTIITAMKKSVAMSIIMTMEKSAAMTIITAMRKSVAMSIIMTMEMGAAMTIIMTMRIAAVMTMAIITIMRMRCLPAGEKRRCINMGKMKWREFSMPFLTMIRMAQSFAPKEW